MPPSLLDSQLQQLEVPDASELYMCFERDTSTDEIVAAILARSGCVMEQS